MQSVENHFWVGNFHRIKIQRDQQKEVQKIKLELYQLMYSKNALKTDKIEICNQQIKL